jgi:hypothetical protein
MAPIRPGEAGWPSHGTWARPKRHRPPQDLPPYIFRPAYIYPVQPRREPNFSYRLLRAIYPAFRVLFPNQVIRADDLARTVVDAVMRGTGKGRKMVLENRDIRSFAGGGASIALDSSEHD